LKYGREKLKIKYFSGFLATMVVIAFFALDQLLREMPHSKLTYTLRDFLLYQKKLQRR
jgi:hypothetical protein